MVTNQTYIGYINEIAGLFCGTNTLCKGSLSTRLKTNLSDAGFENFLANLQQGRGYIHHFSNLTIISQYKWKVDVTFYDIMTNERIAGTWEFPFNFTYSALKSVLATNGFQIIDGDLTYTTANYKMNRIVWKPTKTPSYGIVFVPPAAGGSGGGGTPGGGGSSGGGSGSGGGTIQVVNPPQAVQTSNEVKQAGFDLQSLISNPLVIIGAGVLLFVLLRK